MADKKYIHKSGTVKSKIRLENKITFPANAKNDKMLFQFCRHFGTICFKHAFRLEVFCIEKIEWV